jgi:acetyl/propionyl-CoA carboxylase alpha subunit
MLAKLIATGADRREALARLRAALDATEVLGLTTNLRYLRWLLGQPTMADGEMRTDDLGRLGVPDVPQPDDDAWRSAAIALRSVLPDGVWGGGWRLNAAPAIRITTDEETRTIPLPEDGWTAVGPSAAGDDGVAHVDVEGRSTAFRIAPPPTVESALRQAAADTSDHASLVAPMPGRVIALRAAEGTSVRAGAALVVIEAMKMEHAVVSPIDGLVTRLAVGDGDQVQRGDLLAEVSATDPVP